MDRYREKASNSPQCKHQNPPSFSSTLLDSIYRSIDDEPRTTRKTHPLNPPEITRPTRQHRTRPTHPCPPKHHPPATSTSSDNSSYSESEPSKSKKARFTRFLKGRDRDPVSPASRFANFLNSLFAAKSKTPKNAEKLSRSCISKTSADRGKRGSEKRSVRFYPVSVIVGEDCRPCGHKCLYGEEEEDAGSDSSSDLFELENLVFRGRFQDELPVYETTRLGSYGGVLV